MVSTPKPPPLPDPVLTGRVQTASNVATATANTRLTNADETNPYGKVQYKVMGYQAIPDGLGGVVNVPKYKRIETLNPTTQALLDQEQQADSKLNQLAIDQTDRIGGVLSKPIDLNGLPEAPGDQEAYRQQVENAMNARLQPQLDRQRAALANQLVNQGLVRGSEAFNTALDEVGRQENDAHLQNYLASGQEAREQGSYQATNRERALQERLLGRNQPLNEISALLNGQQVQLPQFTPYRPNPMSETPYGQYVYQGYQGQLDAYKTQAAQAAAGMNAIGGIGSSLIGGLFRLSDRRFKKGIHKIGEMPSGAGLYRFTYKGSNTPQVGVMAQEMERVAPDAVVKVGGVRMVDYARVR